MVVLSGLAVGLAQITGGICYVVGNESAGEWACDCHQDYLCTAGCDASHLNHTCTPKTSAPTPAPTRAPTTESPTNSPTDAPTVAPTPHPCVSGTHGCDKTSRPGEELSTLAENNFNDRG